MEDSGQGKDPTRLATVDFVEKQLEDDFTVS